jgi:hypothetical protein
LARSIGSGGGERYNCALFNVIPARLRNAKLVYHLQNLMLSDRMMHNLRKAAIALVI